MMFRTGSDSRIDPFGRYAVLLTLFAVALFLVIASFGFLLVQVLGSGPSVTYDVEVVQDLNARVHDDEGFVRAMRAITWFGTSPPLYVLLAAAAFYLWRRRRIRTLMFLLLTPATGQILVITTKSVVERARPEVDHMLAIASGHSFPSGHATNSVLFVGTLLLIFIPVVPRRWRSATVVVAVGACLLIGFTRVALGVHYPTDVVAGYALGIGWLMLGTAAFSIWRTDVGLERVRISAGVEPEAQGSSEP